MDVTQTKGIYKMKNCCGCSKEVPKPSTDEAKALQTRALILVTEAAMHGMVAENKQREALGESMVYVDEDFKLLAADFVDKLEQIVKGEA